MQALRHPKVAPASLVILIVIQLACISFFVVDVIIDYRELGRVSSDYVEFTIELVATISMLAACIFAANYLAMLLQSKSTLESRLALARSAIHDIIQNHFDDWDLTSSEREVSMLLVKGFQIAEIAKLRNNAEGTVKAHLNSVYRKSGTRNQAELLSTLIDAMIGDGSEADATAN